MRQQLIEEVTNVIGKAESSTLEYKAVLPPSRTLAQIMAAFANSEGGLIILGVVENKMGIDIIGLSSDFHANSITHKAIDLLSPQTKILYDYVTYDEKKLYAIKIEKSDVPITIEGKIYKRNGSSNIVSNPSQITFNKTGYSRIKGVYFKTSLT